MSDKATKLVIDSGDNVLIIQPGSDIHGLPAAVLRLYTEHGISCADIPSDEIPALIELLQEVLARSAQQKLEQSKLPEAMAGLIGMTFGMAAVSGLGSVEFIKAGDTVHLVRSKDGTFKIEKGPG